MKVNAFSSLGAKLFYLTSSMVLLTVAGNSWQNSRYFRAQLDNQMLQDKEYKAQEASEKVKFILENWRSQVNVTLQNLRISEPETLSRQADILLSSSKEYIGFQIFIQKPSLPLESVSFAFTKDVSSPRFEEQDPKKLELELKEFNNKWLAKEIDKAGTEEKLLENLSHKFQLPIINIALGYPVQGSQDKIWAVLTAWQSNITAALPRTKFIESYVIEDDGKVFASPLFQDMVYRRNLSALPLAKVALKNSSSRGSLTQYKDDRDKTWIGAYSRISGYKGLFIIVQEDAVIAYKATRTIVMRTALWGSLFVLIAVMLSFLGSETITKSLREVTVATNRIAAGDFSTEIIPKSKDEVGVLSLAVNQMSRQIVSLLQNQVEKARFEKELETARIVQSTFFPKRDINLGHLNVTGHYQPASECGGDLWGHFSTTDGKEIVFIADAMGHGAPAALMTAMAYSTCMTMADLLKENSKVFHSPAKLLERMNHVIYNAVNGTISMTCFIAVFDFNAGTLTYANAGHNFPILLPANTGDHRAKKVSKSLAKHSDIPPISLNLLGSPMGVDPGSAYQEKTMELLPGDKVFFYTDGLIECSSPDGRVWGKKTLTEQVLTVAKESAYELKEQLLHRAFEFFGNNPIKDDVTVVVAEVDKQWNKGSNYGEGSQAIVTAQPPSKLPA